MESDTRLLAQLIDKVTEKRNLDCDTDALHRVKRICKAGGTETVRTVFGLLFERLKDNHARVCRPASLQHEIDADVLLTVCSCPTVQHVDFLKMKITFTHRLRLSQEPFIFER